MKPVRKSRSGGDSCSCSTCVYKSESDDPSLRRIIDLGSKIDRLYFGKYIPLRERKLLERLVRTRAVYDDIRAQLVSDSTVSLSTTGNSNVRRKSSFRVLDDNKKSGVGLLEIVNMVDKGSVGSAKLDDCCSCCSCSSGMKLHERKTPIKRYKRKRPYAGANEYEAKERVRVFKERRDAYNKRRGVRFKTKFIKSDPCTCTYKLIKKHWNAIYSKMHHYDRPPLPRLELQTTTDDEIIQKPPRIREIARTSKEMISEGIHKIKESQTRIREKIEFQTKDSLEKYTQEKERLKSKMRDSVQKLKEMSNREKSESHTVIPEDEITIQLKKDSIGKFNEEHRRRQIMKDWECVPECIEDVCLPEECLVKLIHKRLNENSASILNTSKVHNKGIRYNMKTKHRKTGDPLHRINSKIQAQKLGEPKNIGTDKPPFLTQNMLEMKRSLVKFDKSQKTKKIQQIEVLDLNGESKSNKFKFVNAITPQKISADNIKISHLTKPAKKANTKREKDVTKIIPTSSTPEKLSKLENRFLERKSSDRYVVRIGSSLSFDIEFYRTKPGPIISTVGSRSSTDYKKYSSIDYDYRNSIMDKTSKKRHPRHQGSQIGIKKSLRYTQPGGHALKRCFCTLKLKAKATKPKIRRPDTKNFMSDKKSALNSVTVSRPHLLPYECEPGVCLFGECNPYECIKLINKREAKRKDSSTQARKTKSTSSYTSRSNKLTKTKYIESIFIAKPDSAELAGKKKKDNARANAISYSYTPKKRVENVVTSPQRQAVRIGSTFSFNVEFYKGKPDNDQLPKSTELKSLSIRPKQQEYKNVKVKDRGYQGQVQNTNKNSQTQIIKKKHNARIGTTLRRCFCTLKFKKKDTTKIHSKETFTTGTETAELVPIAPANNSSTAHIQSSLLPYECESGVCVPGSCNPYECIKLINIRKAKLDQNTRSQARTTKSSSSYISGSFKPVKAKHVQSAVTTRGDAAKPAVKKGKYYLKQGKEINYSHRSTERVTNVINTSQRQAVRVGSTFSFNIEFYNEDPFTDHQIKRPAELKKLSIRPNQQEYKKVTVKDRGYQGQLKNTHRNSQTQMIKKERNAHIGTTSRRCFCSLQLQKKEILKNRSKETFTTGTATTEFVPIPPALKGGTEQSSLFPYECEPGVCVPGECNPYECVKFINIQKAKRKNAKSQARKKKSTSSYTSRSYNPAKAKYVQSLITSRDGASKALAVKKRAVRRENMTNDSQRHAVRVGSTFSFNIEFYKGSTEQQITRAADLKKLSNQKEFQTAKLNSGLHENVKNISEQKGSQNVKLKDRGFQGNLENTSRTTPTQMIKNERNAHIGTTLEKCFCTLQLKRKEIMKHHIKRTITSGTETSELLPINTANKSTIIKSKYTKPLEPYECEPFTCTVGSCDPYVCLERIEKRKRMLKYVDVTLSRQKTQLEPYECEPFTCIPGECDPLACLERINRRNIVRLKDVGSIGIRSKTTSSSSGNKPAKKSAKVQYKPKYRKGWTKAKPQKLKKNTTNENLLKHMKNTEQENVYNLPSSCKSGQAVKIGSTFNFDIEFSKIKSPITSIKQTYPAKSIIKAGNTTKTTENTKKNKKVKINRLNVAQIKTQVQRPTKRDTGSVVGPLLKRCFCTLNLQKKWKHQHSIKNNSPLSFKPLILYPTVYMVNRATVEDKQAVERNKYQTLFHTHSEQDMLKISRQCKDIHQLHPHRCIDRMEEFTARTVDRRDLNYNYSSSSLTHVSNSISLSHYFRRSFYAWNLKLENKGDIEGYEITHDESSKRKKRAMHKIEPYECEPGVCIPGECNPYECQKLISKRSIKSSAVKSGTDRTLHSISTSVRQAVTKSKRHKQQRLNQKSTDPQGHEDTFKNKQKLPKTNHIYSERSHRKQAVRIGSSFSFDIEFFKNLSIPHQNEGSPKFSSNTNLPKNWKFTSNSKENLIKNYLKPTENRAKLSSISEGAGKKEKLLNTQSQSTIHTTDRGTFTKSTAMKRCFCTLKLQKKGRLYEKLKNEQVVIPSNDFSKGNTVTRGQNTTKIKPIKIIPALEPYECEPNICTPGQCDPYKCLEIMKKRNDPKKGGVGTNTKFNNLKSISSMTTDNRSNKSHKSRTVNVKHKRKLSEKAKVVNHYSDFKYYQKPFREAVRVGSNLSFNIEFFKDHSLPSNQLARKGLQESKHESKEIKHMREKLEKRKNSIKPVLNFNRQTDKYAQNNEKSKYNSSQIDPSYVLANASTATGSFIKRCFCTAQLYKSKIKNEQTKLTNKINRVSNNQTNKNIYINNTYKNDINNHGKMNNLVLKPESTRRSPSFLKRCMYILNKKKHTSSTNKNVIAKETQNDKINRHEKHDAKLKIHKVQEVLKLDPYECKPGICVPGECDPYVCDKIMRNYSKRNFKFADTLTTRSVSISSPNTGKNYVKTLKKDEGNISVDKPIPREKPSKNFPKRIDNTNRKVVKIGSNFSFNIEFYKDHPLSIKDNIKYKTKVIKGKKGKRNEDHPSTLNDQTPKIRKEKLINHAENEKKVKINSTVTHSPSSVSQSSQVKKSKVKDHGTGINNFIKRCFCTLKLYENAKNNYKIKKEEIDESSKKTVNKGVMSERQKNLVSNVLLPYECEPNICVPYQCDPYECEKRIKSRHKGQGNLEFRISAETPKKVSVRSLTTTNKLKTKNQAIKNKDKRLRVKKIKQISHKYKDINKVFHSKQSVRVGSTLSFNVEFFKGNFNDFELHKHPKSHIDNDYHRVQRKIRGERKNTINQTIIGDKIMSTNQTQFDNQMMRTQSTMTGFLRNRCFCTLSLKKSLAKPPLPVETLHASVNTEVNDLKIFMQPTLNSLPYECEPNICTPGECNPILCLERINRRQKTFATATEDPQKRNVATKMIKVKAGKNKKSQIKRLSKCNGKKRLEPKTGNNKGRRAVRIGSNFSFDIEFFKENYPKNMNHIQNQQNIDKQQIINKKRKDKHRLKNQTVRSDLNINEFISRGVQSLTTKKVTHGTGPFLKRCFCTLTLQKNKMNKNPKTVSKPEVKQRKISTKIKSTTTKKIHMKSYDLRPYECEPFYCVLGECDPDECEKKIKTKDLIKNKLPYTTHHLSPFECEPGTCVPGECDPYECVKRIKMRDTKDKTQNTHNHTQFQKGVGIEQGNIKSRKTQANLKNNYAIMPKSSIIKPEIVELPRFNNIFKNQSVRVGSNFSFSIEFYKENLPQTILVVPSCNNQSKMKKQKTHDHDQHLLSYDNETKLKRLKNLHDRNLNTSKTDLRSCESECETSKTENKSTGSQNILKRCFCTLKLQNKQTYKNQKKNDTEATPYHQTFEVRRIAVERNPKMLSKGTHIATKSVSTKIDCKYLKNTHSKKRTELNEDTIEFKTILPYKPEKFNNSVSKTVLPLRNKYKNPGEVVKNRGKKLCRKTSKRSLNTSHSMIQENYVTKRRFYGIKNFITYFAHMFYLKSNSQNYSGNVKKLNKIMRPDQLISHTKPRKCQSSCPYYTKNEINSVNQSKNTLKFNKFMKDETLHMEENQKQPVKKINKNSNSPCNCSNKLLSKKHSAKCKSFGNESMLKRNWSDAITKLEAKNKQTKLKRQILKPRLLNLKSNPTQEILSKMKTEDKLSPCLKLRKGIGYARKERSSPLKVRFLNSTVSNYCHPCKGKYLKEEIHKAAGDQLFKRKILTSGERSGAFLANQDSKPLFEMRLDSGTYDILNRDQVFHNVKKFNTKCHEKPPIEIELDARKLEIVNKNLLIEKVINEKTKKEKNNENKRGLTDLIIDSIMELVGISSEKVCPCHRCVCATRNVSGGKVRGRKGKPCICGSSACAEKAGRMKKSITKHHKWKPCSCGSPVCGSESARIKALTSQVKNKCLCHKEMEKRKANLKAAKLKKENKERAKRLKDYKKHDKIRKAERLKKQRQLERKIDKKAPDAILHTENVLDVGKFGVTVATDVMRQAYRIARDPKHAYQSFKTLKENPELILPCLESAYKESGITGTLRRIRLRCFATRGMTKLRRTLESNPVSRYLLYMGSTDPKKRLMKKKKKKKSQMRERERLDFDCSLYMASLRKRPHLSVYDRCPWFYPHFLRIVNVWKQFTDICLYLVAAVVWSPCILCMELCRACMCCFFCTG